MNKSESIKELATALAKAQGDITNAAKNAKNPHFRSNYADLSAILDTVRPVFSEYGLSVMQMPSFENGILSVETMVMHNSGEWISSTISAPVSKHDAQGVGSATTYMRRYSLAAMAGIAQADDDGEAAIGRQKAPSNIHIEGAIQQINSVKSRGQLTELWQSLDKSVRGHANVLASFKNTGAKFPEGE